MKPVTTCPNCGAQDSLYQEVHVDVHAERRVHIEGTPGSQKVNYDAPEIDGGPEDIAQAENISCGKCGETWGGEMDLLDIGPPIEHRCTGCDWWGFADFQHALERGFCGGTVYRIDKPPAEVAA